MDRILLQKTLLDFCDQWKTRKNTLENKWDIAKYVSTLLSLNLALYI